MQRAITDIQAGCAVEKKGGLAAAQVGDRLLLAKCAV
jgi:hypothetical protein